MSTQKTHHLTHDLAEYAVSAENAALTANDIQMALLSTLDWTGAAISGKDEECVKKVASLMKSEGASGNCVLIAQNERLSSLAAALINGTESHALDFDDIHDFLSLHLTSPVLPAALAAAESVGASGMRMLEAAVKGMHIMVALSAGIMPEHYNLGRWHATGTIGVFGAAAAAGYLLGLSQSQMCNAFGIAPGLCSGIQLNFGTMAKPMCAGMAARNGLMSAMLAKNGFTGRADIFDTDFLCNVSMKKDFSEIIGKIEARLAAKPLGVHEVRFKRYPCGAPTHSGILNCKKILAENSFRLDDIQKIIFEPYPRAVRLVGEMHPQTGLEGKFSIAFTAAAQMVFNKVTIETFTDENVRDPRVVKLMNCMELVPNDEFTPSRGGKTTIILKDGKSFTNSTYLLNHPISLEETAPEVKDKYFEIADPRLGHSRAESLFKTVMELDKISDIKKLDAVLQLS